MNHFNGSRYLYVSLNDATEEYYRYCQSRISQTLDSYYKTFKAHAEVLEHYGTNVGGDKAFLLDVEKSMTEVKPSNLSSPTYLIDLALFNAAHTSIAHKKATAITFLKHSDPVLYGYLWTDLQHFLAEKQQVQHDPLFLDIVGQSAVYCICV